MVWQGFRLWLPQQQVFEGGAVQQWPCCITYLDQALWHTEWNHKIQKTMIITTDQNPHWQQIAVCFLYCFSGLWAFCQAVLLLTYIVATKIGNYLELDWWNIIHILGFVTPTILPTWHVIMSALSIFSSMDLRGCGYMQVFNDLGVGTFLTQNEMVWEHAYICAGCLFHCITVADWML